MPPLDELVRESLRAALLDPPTALVSWNRALALAPLEDWPSALARPLPQTYLHLRHQPSFEPTAAMRGIYRAAWTSNMVKLNRASALCASLSAHGVEHRVFKGGAVCSWLGNWGLRRMGDIDLSILSEHWEVAEAQLRNAGFSPRFPQREGPSLGCWDDGQGGVLDVHVAEQGSPLREALFAEPANHIAGASEALPVPGIDLCMAIAICHAVRGAAESDLVQGLLDVGNLEALVTPHRVATWLVDLRGADEAEFVFEALRDLGWRPENQWSEALAAARKAIRRTVRRRDLAQRRLAVSRGVRVLRRRSCSPWQLTRSQPWLLGRPRYLAWLTFARIRPVEAWNIRNLGGFMPSPVAQVNTASPVLIEFGEKRTVTPQVIAWNAGSIERRFRVNLPHAGRVRISLALSDAERVERHCLLFLNGRVFGSFPLADSDVATYELDVVDGTLEGSLRALDGRPMAWAERLTLRYLA